MKVGKSVVRTANVTVRETKVTSSSIIQFQVLGTNKTFFWYFFEFFLALYLICIYLLFFIKFVTSI